MEGSPDRFIAVLTLAIRWALRALAVLLTLVVLWGVVDVAWLLYQRLGEPPAISLGITDLVATFGAFLAVLVGVEIFVNVVIALKTDRLAVDLVIATALVALARKAIIFEYDELSPWHLAGMAAMTLALAVAYALVRWSDRKPTA